MTAVVMPTDEECYLLAILESPDGLDLAEFAWFDPESDDGCYRAWDFQWCVSGDTLVVTDQGRKPIRELVGEVTLLTSSPGSREASWKRARVDSFGVRRLWEVTLTRRGERKVLHATAEHAWLVAPQRQSERRRYERVATRDLAVGAWVHSARAPAVEFALDRVAVQRGVVWGDGTHIRNVAGHPSSSRVNLWGEKKVLAEWFDVEPRQRRRDDVAVDCYYMSPLPVDHKLRPVGLEEPSAARWGWLAGYFATDGAVAPDGTCTLSSAERQNLEHVKDVCISLGVSTGAVRELGPRSFAITLRSADLPVPFFLKPSHALKRQQKAKPDWAPAEWRIEAVTATDQFEEVFCAIVGGTHTFVLDDGILTGNCWYTNNAMYQIDQGGRALGKALALDTPIPTPDGWTTMGDLKDGDRVFDDCGMVATVTAAHDVQHERPCYEVVFSDGSVIVCDEDHLWETYNRLERKSTHRFGDRGRGPSVRTTKEIAETLRHQGETNHSIDVAAPLLLPARQLPADPYVFGAWVVQDLVTRRGVPLQVVEQLRNAGVRVLTGRARNGTVPHIHIDQWLGDDDTFPRIPTEYLRASVSQRRMVLHGVMDVAGYIAPDSQSHVELLDEGLADDLFELLVSLGEQPRKSWITPQSEHAPCWRVAWRARVNPCLHYNVNRFKPLDRSASMTTQRRIIEVRPVPSVPVRCITVDSPSSLYLAGRAMIPTHNTVGIKMRAFAFPFAYEGQSMLVSAPELNHLRPLTDMIERSLLTTRLMSEMLPLGKGRGMARQPHWQVKFKNGTTIVSRLPNKDGKGVKGQHVINIELDEAQDYPWPGWTEIVETLNAGLPGAMWRCHGVSRGIRDKFFEKTQPGSGWVVHRPMAMHRPTWGKVERENKIKEYGGSRQSIDYKRNIYGEHGDASNSVFVLARLMDCVDLDEGSTYNTEVYVKVVMEFEHFPPNASDDERLSLIESLIDLPGSHKTGYSQKVGLREVGAPKGYTAYWAGMDIGVTNHPSELLVFGQRSGTDFLELLTRIQMHRIHTDDQQAVVDAVFAFYGKKMRIGVDKTGVGFPVWDSLTRRWYGSNVYGFGFSEKRICAIEDRELEAGETIEDLARERNVIESSTDWLRNDYVDAKKFRLPYDREVLIEFQGQTYCCDSDTEILTRRGWLRYDEVRVGDETLGLFDEQGLLCSRWTSIEAVNVFPVGPRDMIALEGTAHSSMTTPDHRWLGKPYHHARYAEWRTSRDLLGPEINFRIPLSAQRVDPPDISKHSDDFVELVAWYYTEGHLKAGRKISISQSPTANPHNVDAIEGMLRRLLGPGHVDIGQGRRGTGRWSCTTAKRPGAANQYTVLDRELCTQVLTVVRGPEKVVDPAFLAELTLAQLHLFIDTSIGADGCAFARERDGKQPTVVFTFKQSSEDRMRSFEMACALAGVATKTSYNAARGEWQCTLLKRRHAHLRSMQRRAVEYDGVVWCPTTATGTWLARRAGSVFFTGNTTVRDTGDPYGKKRIFAGGSFHTLDAAKMMAAAKHIPPLEALLEAKPQQESVLDQFIGIGM